MRPSRPESVVRDGQMVAVVYTRLLHAILDGSIAPGRVTSQLELARDLEVSRTPLREALRMLEREGLVVLDPNRRVRIAPLSLDDAEDLYVSRVALETVAIKITVPLLKDEDIAELEGFMAQMDHLAAAGSPRYDHLHSCFHGALCRAAGDRVDELMGQLASHTHRYRVSYTDTWQRERPRWRTEHRAILDAARAADPVLAADELAAHYVHTARRIVTALEPGYPLERLRQTVAITAPGALAAFGSLPLVVACS
jgi:GntR family transcriptional regulator, rspAB operon transcriptional repressor